MKPMLLLAMVATLGCSRTMALRDQAWADLVDKSRHDFKVGDQSLHYIDLGAGQPVLLIHGIADSTYSWHENVRALLEAGLRVIIVDQPGFGNSDPAADGIYSVEKQGEAILRVLDHLGIERFGLVGHSLGGGVSLYLGWKHPERISRFAVISPVSQHERCLFGVMTDIAMGVTGTRWFVGRALRSAYFEPDKLSDIAIDEYGRLLDRPGRAGRGVLGAVCSTYFSPTFDQMMESYAQIKVPLLIIWGQEDSWHSVEHGEVLHSLVPDSELALVPNAGHNVHQERAAEVNQLLLRFFTNRSLGGAMSKSSFAASRIRKSWEQQVATTPDKVFPLLCPVREYEWIPGWTSSTVYLESGHAEEHGVFITDFPERGRGTWVIARYEPPHDIGFVIFYSHYVEQLAASLALEGKAGTRLRWTRTYTGLDEEGNRFLAQLTGSALDARMERQMKLLDHFCATGKMMLD